MEIFIGPIIGTVGLIVGALIYGAGLKKGISISEKMIAIWSKTEKSLQKQKTENIKEVMKERAQIGVITE